MYYFLETQEYTTCSIKALKEALYAELYPIGYAATVRHVGWLDDTKDIEIIVKIPLDKNLSIPEEAQKIFEALNNVSDYECFSVQDSKGNTLFTEEYTIEN